MRILAVAAALLMLLALPASAQMPGGKHRPSDDGKAKVDNTPKVDEKAYNDALKRIPEPKEKYDPWGGARPSTDKPAK
jgi:hypothetical protein